jgi:hypothetical protein
MCTTGHQLCRCVGQSWCGQEGFVVSMNHSLRHLVHSMASMQGVAMRACCTQSVRCERGAQRVRA